MELHQLRYVLAVARNGNFSRAAEQCHVAQPSLSQQIQKLEEELGERIFERLKSGALLTPAGEAFLPRAMRILEEVDAAHRDVQDAHELLRGTVTIGVLPTIAPYYLPGVLTKFRKARPGIQVIVQEDITTRLLKMVTGFEVDVAIVSPPFNETGLEKKILFEEELWLSIPDDHPMAKQRVIQASDLDGEAFILMKEGHCLGDQVLSFCTNREFHPNVSCRSAQIETIQAMVKAGLGVSLIPNMAKPSGKDPGRVYRSLAGPKPKRTIVAVWPSNRIPSRAVGEFLRVLDGKVK